MELNTMSNSYSEQHYAYSFDLFLKSIGKDPEWVLMRAEILRSSYLLISKVPCIELETFISELRHQCSPPLLEVVEVDDEWSDEDRYAWEERVDQENWELAEAAKGKCAGCGWATGEDRLPCAVNPFAYGQGCFDYEAS